MDSAQQQRLYVVCDDDKAILIVNIAFVRCRCQKMFGAVVALVVNSLRNQLISTFLLVLIIFTGIDVDHVTEDLT